MCVKIPTIHHSYYRNMSKNFNFNQKGDLYNGVKKSPKML